MTKKSEYRAVTYVDTDIKVGCKLRNGFFHKFVELDASHWLVQEKFEEVSKEILDHLKRNPL